MEVADLIEKVREKNNWNPMQLADALGVSQRTIYNYESGETKPPRRIIKKLNTLAGIENLDDGDIDQFEKDGVEDLKEKLQKAEIKAEVYQAKYELFLYLFDRVIEKANITIQGDMGGIKERLGALRGNKIASGSS